MENVKLMKFGIIPADTIIQQLVPILKKAHADAYTNIISQYIDNYFINMQIVKDPEERLDVRCQAWQWAQAYRFVCKRQGWFSEKNNRPINWMEVNHYE